MKMFKKLSITIIGAALLPLAASAATLLTGSINFTGGVTLNNASAAAATGVINWYGAGGVGNPIVQNVSGTLDTLVDPTNPVSFAPAWNFNSGAVPSFWSITVPGGSLTFNLTSSSILSQGGTPGTTGFVNVGGTGTMTGPAGYDSNTFAWSFSVQDPSAMEAPGATFSIRAGNVNVPDGGSSLLMLGSVLIGFFALSRRFLR
jgi:hypothetical protein